MSEQTVNRDVSITIAELRAATVEMIDMLSASEMLRQLPRDQVPLVHAFQLGCVLRASGIAPNSIGTVLQFVRLGYDDYGENCE